MTPSTTPPRKLIPFIALAVTLLLVSPSVVHAHGAGDQFGEAIVWLVVLAVVALIALVVGCFLVIAWLVRRSRGSREDSDGMTPS